MLKNRESAARSRLRRQQFTEGLERENANLKVRRPHGCAALVYKCWAAHSKCTLTSADQALAPPSCSSVDPLDFSRTPQPCPCQHQMKGQLVVSPPGQCSIKHQKGYKTCTAMLQAEVFDLREKVAAMADQLDHVQQLLAAAKATGGMSGEPWATGGALRCVGMVRWYLLTASLHHVFASPERVWRAQQLAGCLRYRQTLVHA